MQIKMAPSFATKAGVFLIMLGGAMSLRSSGRLAGALRSYSHCTRVAFTMASDVDPDVPRFKSRRAREDVDVEPIGDGPSEADLLSDIARYKVRDVEKQAATTGGSPLVAKVINGLGFVLTCNFVIIVGLFGWFIVGAVAQLGFKSMAPIMAFRGAWDPFIMPLLTTHMTLTFLSKALEKLTGNEAEGSIGGNWKV